MRPPPSPRPARRLFSHPSPGNPEQAGLPGLPGSDSHPGRPPGDAGRRCPRRAPRRAGRGGEGTRRVARACRGRRGAGRLRRVQVGLLGLGSPAPLRPSWRLWVVRKGLSPPAPQSSLFPLNLVSVCQHCFLQSPKPKEVLKPFFCPQIMIWATKFFGAAQE